MTRGSASAALVIAVLYEASKHFGAEFSRPENREQVARWIRKRVRELTDGPDVRERDFTKSSAGDV